MNTHILKNNLVKFDQMYACRSSIFTLLTTDTEFTILYIA